MIVVLIFQADYKIVRFIHHRSVNNLALPYIVICYLVFHPDSYANFFTDSLPRFQYYFFKISKCYKSNNH